MKVFIHKYTNQLTFITFSLIILAFIFGGGTKDTLLIIATVVAGVPIALKAFQAIKLKTFSIELLVTIAVIGALFIGEYVESAIVTFLFLFGSYLEARTLEKTRSSVRELVDMAPDEAVVVRNGIQETISIDDVVEGDRIIIHSGGRVPVDGKIMTGQASINEAAVTGESVSASKRVNDNVFSGTIVDNGYVEMIAEKVGDDTTFAKIIELVEDAQESKSKTEKFLNKFANIYTPAVVVLSIFVYLLTQDLHMGITFLVIACPGALVIGAPVSSVAGIGNGAKNGVLIKGGEVMDNMSKVDIIVFDKTGPLTKGKPEVTDVKTFGKESENKLFKMIAQAELISEHHLGKTIVKEAEKRELKLGEVPKGEIIKGNGLRATVENQDLVIGTRKLMAQFGLTISKEIEAYAVEQEKQGNTAKLVANKLGLDEYYAELLPEDKVSHVKKLQAEGHVVAMAGDGINDAPAIATADIGLAMGEGGTDVSMETADVVLMADKLTQFSHAYSLAKATILNMKQNTFIAIGTVVLLLIGVLNGTVHLASGMFVHEASVLTVILNGMRLITFNPKKVKAKVKTDIEVEHTSSKNI